MNNMDWNALAITLYRMSHAKVTLTEAEQIAGMEATLKRFVSGDVEQFDAEWEAGCEGEPMPGGREPSVWYGRGQALRRYARLLEDAASEHKTGTLPGTPEELFVAEIGRIFAVVGVTMVDDQMTPSEAVRQVLEKERAVVMRLVEGVEPKPTTPFEAGLAVADAFAGIRMRLEELKGVKQELTKAQAEVEKWQAIANEFATTQVEAAGKDAAQQEIVQLKNDLNELAADAFAATREKVHVLTRLTGLYAKAGEAKPDLRQLFVDLGFPLPEDDK